MSKGMKISHAKIVLPDRVLEGHVYIDGDVISRIEPLEDGRELTTVEEESLAGHTSAGAGAADAYELLQARGMYLMPGLVDIHSDAIEKEVQPRPNTLFPMDMAMIELEKKLLACGITTMYHSLSLGVGLSLRGDEIMLQLIDLINRYHGAGAMLHHRIHLRYELTYLPGLKIAQKLLENGSIHYLSFMNHSPGQGQYKAPGSFAAYVMKNQGVDREEVQNIIDHVLKMQSEIDWKKLQSLAKLANSNGLRIASHDDDSPEKVNRMMKFGVSVSEFPLNLQTAAYAKEHRLHACAGAPNVIRGGSHDGNMRAIEAVKAGYVDILCSDYQPSALIWSVFTMLKEGLSLPEAVNMVSLNPAKALGIDSHIGSIEAGKKADLLLLDMSDGRPTIRKVFVGGAVAAEFGGE